VVVAPHPRQTVERAVHRRTSVGVGSTDPARALRAASSRSPGRTSATPAGHSKDSSRSVMSAGTATMNGLPVLLIVTWYWTRPTGVGVGLTT